MTKHEAAQAIASDGYCIESETHEWILCENCPASNPGNPNDCLAGDCHKVGTPNGDFAAWFKAFLAANPEPQA